MILATQLCGDHYRKEILQPLVQKLALILAIVERLVGQFDSNQQSTSVGQYHTLSIHKMKLRPLWPAQQWFKLGDPVVRT